MKIPLYQIDAFTADVFRGNPAAVCPLAEWLDVKTMQAIAAENNLSETAFLVKNGAQYEIRWFTPRAEVDLCGHATLAAAFVLFNHLDTGVDRLEFSSRSGTLTVVRQGDLLRMDFPALVPVACNAPISLLKGLGPTPRAVLRAMDYLAVYDSEEEILALKPDMARLRECDLRGVIVTARGRTADFVSRFFAPKFGIDEDPVTGSAHCALVPYWKGKLNKHSLHALQLSERGGELFCEDLGKRIAIAGRAVQYLQGTISF